jgi:hypothetical protein
MWFCDGLVLVERPDAWDSEAFDIACCRGDLDAAKSLLAKGHVDIHYEWDLPFVGACRNGHLAVAQWLHGLGDVGIHTCADRPFQMACCGGFLATAKWLYSLGGGGHSWPRACRSMAAGLGPRVRLACRRREQAEDME